MEPSKKKLLIRYSQPGKYDHAPQGTECKIVIDERTYDLYRQTSSKEDDPIWDHVGTFMQKEGI